MDKKFDKGVGGKSAPAGKDAKGGTTPAGMKPAGKVTDAKPVGTRSPGKG